MFEKWVDDFHPGDEILSSLFLSKALYYSQSGDPPSAEKYVDKAKQAIEETSSSYFLCRVLTVEGDVLFSAHPAQAEEAYLACISYCQKASLVTTSAHILEEFKTCLIVCNYKLALLERLDANGNETILKYLCEAARSARDLFGEDSPVFQRFEQYYFEEETRKKRLAKGDPVLLRVDPVDDSEKQLIYEGLIACSDSGYQGSGDITIYYRAHTKELDVEFRKESKGRREKIQMTERLEIPAANLPDLAKKLSWISITNNKIHIHHAEIRKIISEEQKQYRSFLKQIGREEMFDERDIANSSDEDEERQGRTTSPLLSPLKNLSAFAKHPSLKN